MEDDDDNDARVPQGATEMLLRILSLDILVQSHTASEPDRRKPVLAAGQRSETRANCNYVNGDDLARLCRWEGTGDLCRNRRQNCFLSSNVLLKVPPLAPLSPFGPSVLAPTGFDLFDPTHAALLCECEGAMRSDRISFDLDMPCH